MPANTAKHHSIYIRSTGEVFPAREGVSVLSALAPTHGECITAGCFGGGCGVCKIQVLEGQYRSGPMSKSHVSDEEAAQGYGLACKVIPESDLYIRVLRKVPAKLGHRFGYLAS